MTACVAQGDGLITTVIPTFQRPVLLARAVSSVLEQASAPVRVRVFDNASQDNTGEMILALAANDPRVMYYRHPENIGGLANFDFAIRAVDTEFFSILSDDDYLLPGFFEHAIRDLTDNPDAMFWAGTTLDVDPAGVIVDARVDRWEREGKFDAGAAVLKMTGGRAPQWTGIVFRTRILQDIGFPDLLALGPMDLDFTIRAAALAPFILRKYPSAVFTLNLASYSATQPMSSFLPGWERMIANARAASGLQSPTREALVGALLADLRRMLFRRGVNAVSMGRYDFAADACVALRGSMRAYYLAALLAAGRWCCMHIPGVQKLCSDLYRQLERRIILSRGSLQSVYGHLLRRS